MIEKKTARTKNRTYRPECRGAIAERTITLVYTQGEIVLQIRDVPALVCVKCGKQVVSGDVANHISEILQRLEKNVSMRRLSDDVLQLRNAVRQVQAASLEVAFA